MLQKNSLFYPGGTISDNDIFKNKYGIFALNDNYLFIAKDHKSAPIIIKYEIQSEFIFKILKTKIKISSKDRFIKFMTDDLYDCFQRVIFNELLKRG